MTLASSGTLSMGGSTANRSINLELSRSATAQITLNETAVRTLANKPTNNSIISISDFYGKSAFVAGTLSIDYSSIDEANVFTCTLTFTSNPNQQTWYWRVASLSNLQNNDFDFTSGSFSVTQSGANWIGTFYVWPSMDSTIEGSGTFVIQVAKDSGYTDITNTSSTLTITDYYTAWTGLSRDNIYRYANNDSAYTATVAYFYSNGMNGSTVHWQILSNSYGISTGSDISTGTSGTFVVNGVGEGSVTIGAAIFNGGTTYSYKDFYVRFRLNNSSGQILADTSTIVLWGTPTASITIGSPNPTNEGSTTSYTLNWSNFPSGSPAPSTIYLTASGSADVTTDWYGGSSSFTFDLTSGSGSSSGNLTAAIDSLSEGQETITFTWRLNSTGGSSFGSGATWYINQFEPSILGANFYINGANQNGASRTITCQITNVASYPDTRSWQVWARTRLYTDTVYTNAWSNLGTTVTVNGGSTSSALTTVYGPVTASVQIDARFRLILAGHTTLETGDFQDFWMG